jgi:hypothetical protein
MLAGPLAPKGRVKMAWRCPHQDQKVFRVPNNGDEIVERWGAGTWEVERAAELKGYSLERDVLDKANAWYKSITCEDGCNEGEFCKKGHLWVGPPQVVKSDPVEVVHKRFTSKWRMKVHAEAKLQVMCVCTKNRRR